MKLILIILFIYLVIFHFTVINPIEKLFVQNIINVYKRPTKECLNDDSFKCLGMPSGHAEVITMIMILLLLMNFTSIIVCMFFIAIVCLHRYVFKKHTITQIIMGIILGVSYAFIYFVTYGKIGGGGIIILSILLAVVGIVTITYSINLKMIKAYPQWIDRELYSIIDKKTNISFVNKCFNTLANIVVYNMSLYCSWNDFEDHIKRLVEQTNAIEYDVIVGIKSGGAFMANYMGKLLDMKYVYVKMAKKCDKNTYDTIDDVIDNRVLHKNVKFSMCEEITENLTGKKVLLLDETSSSGKTFYETREYLIKNKKVSKVTCACLYSSDKSKYLFGPELITLNQYGYILYPWGFDN